MAERAEAARREYLRTLAQIPADCAALGVRADGAFCRQRREAARQRYEQELAAIMP